ncbi:Glycosyltransferase, GT2 family [Lachnospiraceae bacterium RM5]|nr:Glycosyltransferase, GT2 family [Lachnospiraceae bacterium RM5]
MHFHTIYIGVNYKTPQKTIEWARSIKKTNPNSLVVVVDNSSNDAFDLEKEIEGIALYIDSGGNLGYFNGAAFGLHKIEQIYTFEWIVVSNVDLILKTENIDQILDRFSDASIVAPGIISYDTGFDKNPYRLSRPSKRSIKIKKIAFSNIVFYNIYGFLSRLRNEAIKKKHKETKKCEEGTKIYLPYGAVIFFSNKYFESGCKIDFPLFLFGEELFVAEQANKKNQNIIYVPSIEFENYEHASTSNLSSNSVNKRNYKAMKFILEEFYN